jgi:hypothetical protein
MDLNAYLLNQVVEATAPPNETEAAARFRADAIVEMVRAYDPRDGMESMIACQCVMLQFLLNAAMRAASDINLEPRILAKSSAHVMAISRTLRQWVAQFDKVRKRNEIPAKEITQTRAAATEPATMQSPAEKSRDAPVAPPVAPPGVPVPSTAIRAPMPNGRTAAVQNTVAEGLLAAESLSNTQGSIAAANRAMMTQHAGGPAKASA